MNQLHEDTATIAAPGRLTRDCEPTDRSTVEPGIAQTGAPLIQFLKPSECANWKIPDGHHLIGDHHIVRGEIFIIGGTQGVGKSRAVTYLAGCGATGDDWFGRKVHSQFRTLVIQNENGMFRLKGELSAACEETGLNLDEWLRVSPPPDDGLRFSDPNFREEIAEEILRFRPGVIVVDPWNAVAADDTQKSYIEAFKYIQAATPAGEDKPAIGIVAHLRKPNVNDRRGRDGMHRLSGSYALASRPRSIFIMDSASNDETDDRVVWSCPKNNNGQLGQRSAWHRSGAGFVPCEDFDWDEYDADGRAEPGRPAAATPEDYAALLPPEGLTYTAWLKKAGEELGVSKATFSRAIPKCTTGPKPLVHKSAALERYQPIKSKLVS
jgi:hypothetical protein